MSNYLFYKFFFIPVGWGQYYLANFSGIIDGFIRVPFGEEDYKRIFQIDILGVRERNALFWGRYVTAFFGVGSVYLVYLLSKKMFNEWVGLMSAFLLAINFRHVLNSHIGLPDIYNAFFLLLALIFIYNVWRKPSLVNYLLAAVTCGISLSVKYQFFSFLPFLMVHLDLSLKQKDLEDKFRFLFSKKALLVPLIIIFTFVLLNPYLFIKIEETIVWLTNVSLKYGVGTRTFMPYSFYYLYKWGMGKAVFLLVLVGMCVMLFRNSKRFLFLFSVVFPFFYITSYYTAGGYYTRNFVTIIPILLIFVGYFLYELYLLLKVNKYLSTIFILGLLLLAGFSNLKNSYVVTLSYSKPWNFAILAMWLGKNIPDGARVSAHSSVPLAPSSVRLPYDFEESFSLAEFVKDGADFAVTNLDWETSNFYWWIRPSEEPLKQFADYKFGKPVFLMKDTYEAMVLEELSDYAIYTVLNPWQAPDSNFIVAKIPKYNVVKKEIKMYFNFDKDTEGWFKKGEYGIIGNSFSYKEGGLFSAMQVSNSPAIRWSSKPIDIRGWEGFGVEALMIANSQTTGVKNGFIFVEFYKNEHDAELGENRLAVRVSLRNEVVNKETKVNIFGELPTGANYMTLGFRVYKSVLTEVLLDELVVYNAEVIEDPGDWKLTPLRLDNNILFPNSHGNL